MFSFGRKDVFIQPFGKRNIIGKPPEQRHGKMGMSVDQTGHNYSTPSVNYLPGLGKRPTSGSGFNPF